jgi:excisionase family DNA binding protein
MAQEDWITTREAAEISGYHQKYIPYLINSGKINARKFGDVWQIDRASLLAYLRKIEKSGAKRGPKTGA